MNKTHLPIFAISIAAILVGVVFTYGSFGNNSSSQTYEHGVMLGHIQLILTGSDGNVKQYVQTDNLIVDEGMDTMIDLMFPDTNLNGNSTDNKFKYIGIGTGNTGAAAGNIGEETLISGCNRIADGAVTGSSAISGESTGTVDAQFSGATCASTTVREAVLTNSGTDAAANAGELLARQTFTAINLGASDTLTVTWNITVT